jgi:hypothetical protein
MEHTGLPIDVRWYGAVQACLSSLVREAKTRAGQYPGGHATLADYADSEKLLDSWPRIRTGQLSTSRRAFRVMSARDPRLNQIVADLKLAAGLDVPPLAPDADGRLRFDARPFSSITGRNQPRSANYIFAHSNWYRALIAPPPGYAHVYLDWEAQEYGIAAALSQDPVMCGFYREGDPYEAMAVKTGAAGPGRVDPIVRARQKTVALGTLYGMGPGLLAQRLKVSEAEAVEILRGHRRLHPRFWRWSQDVVAAATFTGQISSVFGWPMTVTSATKVTTLMNFPIQANAAEMLRLACILAHRRGVTMLATVHDAILVEARIDDVGSVVAEMRDCMARASRAVLDGFELRVDSTVTPWPEHWAVSDNTTLQHVAERCGWPL